MRALLLQVAAALATLLAASGSVFAETPPIKVVASFSILADFVRNVGGDRITLTALVGPLSDAHVYAPTPSDAKTVAAARLVFVNGLGFEGWLPRLVASTGNRATVVEATRGITPRKAEGDGGNALDPHAWQSVANAKTYVANIRDALSEADPPGAAIYAKNASGYLDRLEQLDRDVRAAVAAIPSERRKVVSTHDAFGYFAAAYGVAFIAPQGVSTDTEPSAQDIAAIIREIRSQHIAAVFLERLGDPRLIGQVASETGATVGGALYSDSLTPPDGEAPTYIAMMKHNVGELTRALARP